MLYYLHRERVIFFKNLLTWKMMLLSNQIMTKINVAMIFPRKGLPNRTKHYKFCFLFSFLTIAVSVDSVWVHLILIRNRCLKAKNLSSCAKQWWWWWKLWRVKLIELLKSSWLQSKETSLHDSKKQMNGERIWKNEELQSRKIKLNRVTFSLFFKT